jgi:hypothetical protein
MKIMSNKTSEVAISPLASAKEFVDLYDKYQNIYHDYQVARASHTIGTVSSNGDNSSWFSNQAQIKDAIMSRLETMSADLRKRLEELGCSKQECDRYFITKESRKVIDW